MHHLDCVSYKLLVFQRLPQELVTEPDQLQLPFQALQLIGRNNKQNNRNENWLIYNVLRSLLHCVEFFKVAIA